MIRLALALTFSLLSIHAFATEDDTLAIDSRAGEDAAAIPPAEAFARTRAVLAHYRVPADEDPAPWIADVGGRQTAAGIAKLLKFLDPTSTFRRLSVVSNDRLTVFQDLDGKRVEDFSAPLKSSSPVRRFEEIPLVDPARPLAGVRVALDPGHMGGDLWDKRTGKYVKDSAGRVVSEGVIALQTALLLREDLRRLGAEVLVTHEELRPVTPIDYASFDLTPYARNELSDNAVAPWFRKLLSAGTGPALTAAFEKSPERKKLFSSSQRQPYFVERADLWARAAMINDFKADIVVIIHFDTAEPPGNPVGVNPAAPNTTKTFVVGSYADADLSSRTTRKYFARHLLDQRSWDLSLKLGRSILGEFRSQLGLKLAAGGGPKTTTVEPGIFARNLQLPRRLKAPAITYLECLFYNRPQEFNAFADARHPMTIGGKNVPYSDRVVQVKNAIRDGVVGFVRATKRGTVPNGFQRN